MGLVRSIVGALAPVLLALTLASAAGAADRRAISLPDTDLPGFDYSTIKNTTAGACEAACVDDRICRAFTFNEKAKWCFLKADAGIETPFDGARSGRIEQSPTLDEVATTRANELPFYAQDLIEGARSFGNGLPASDAPPAGLTYNALVESGDASVTQANFAAAAVSYRQALAINRNDPALWLKLSTALLKRLDVERAAGNTSGLYDMGVTASYAAMSAFILSEARDERAPALAALADALANREMWQQSIASYRLSLALIDDTELQARLDKVVAEHGFRIASNQVDSESATPRICLVFSEALPPGSETDLADYIVVDGLPTAAIATSDNQACIEGVQFGLRYKIKVRAGLPAASGETLRADAEINAYVPDRTAFVGFANTAYVMPAGLGGGLPITSVNAETADVMIYRIGDRSIATAVRNGTFQRTLDGYSASDIAEQTGEMIWEGKVDLAKSQPNEMITTALPVSDVLKQALPGAYVITAKVEGSTDEYWQEMATQWFIVTDLGLTTVSGDDGVHAFLRALDDATPVSGAKVKLVAVNNEVLGEGVTDAAGHAVFAAGLARGTGGRAPQLLVAETEAGDYAFLDLSKPAFDLTDRGVEGRPSPGPLDLFATTERGVYRPGETVFLTALLRDTDAKAVAGLPLTLQLERPDGVVATSEVLQAEGAGGYFTALPLMAEAMRGSWTIRLFADPKAEALSSVTFLVEDFEPERLAFEVSAPDQPMPRTEPTTVTVAAKYLYGATAPGLDIEADVVLRPVTTLPSHPGFVFGRLDDTFQTYREPLGSVGATDESGNAEVEINLPETEATTRPLEAQVILSLIDSSGRPVTRSLTRPVLAEGNRIGLRPAFEDDSVAEGSEARFDAIVVAPDDSIVAEAGLTWQLYRIETTYQWYRRDGTWRWEPLTTTTQVADGTVDATAGAPVSIGANVDWGRYRFEIATADGATSSSYEFYAGYYYPEVGTDTPDTLDVALDRQSYRLGDIVSLKLDPQFAGTALVMVVDDKIIDMQAVEVPEGGTTVPLTVTDAWGPGAYVTAVLYRPASAPEKRMPARALGLAYAEIEPGDRQLATTIEAPAEVLPRRPFEAKVKLANVQPGQKAYVAVAAVDLGILNLTRFEVPDPDGYFFGQRQLGMSIRDLYGRLIDPMQGLPGSFRSGGDGDGGRNGTPPPTSVLVAVHTGIVEVGADGTATVSLDMPDFAGTARVMAIAWTETAVGHASTDVIVRDPVVVAMSPPRFLRVGDDSRLLVEINNVSGQAGDYVVGLTTEEGLTTSAAETTVTLGEDERTSLNLPLEGGFVGDPSLTLSVRGPSGDALIKQLQLGVRATSAPETTARLETIAPGGTLTLDASRFAAFLPHSASLTLSVGPIARLNVPELLLSLDRYPYGCAEQITSRAIPLIYLNEVAQAVGLGSDDQIAARVRDAIANVVGKQTSSGAFGLWGPFSYTDLWLDAYVTDFLLRAQKAGFDVPAQALSRALDNLGNQLSYAADFETGGEDIAAALLSLARGGRASMGDLRYYFEAKLGALSTPLAKAQLGAALAVYGDRTRAGQAFAAAIEALDKREDKNRYRTDYGTQLRDAAGVLALAAEFNPAGVDLTALAERLSTLRDAKTWTSTQEDAWTLLAAAALVKQTGDGSVTIDGTPLTGSVFQRYAQEHFDGASVAIANTGNKPVEVMIALNGIPATPPPERSTGFSIAREVMNLDGTPADLSTVTQNDRFVVVLTAKPDTLGSGQYMIADPLPAGFEIENPNLLEGSGVGDLSWLTLDTPAHVESRTDQFVAAFRFTQAVGEVRTAYLVRAVTPGEFAQPGATVEDMYRPELRGNTAAGSIEVVARTP